MSSKDWDGLSREFPNLYSRSARWRKPLKEGECFRFEVGDGWYDLVREFSQGAERYILSLPEEERSGVFATCVKEKFGSLTIYTSQYLEPLSKASSVASNKSIEVCIECGAPGQLRQGSWIRPLCDACSEGAKPYPKGDEFKKQYVAGELALPMLVPLGFAQRFIDEPQ